MYAKYTKLIIGVVLIVIGGIMYFSSRSIAAQIAEGQGQINSAQGQVDTAGSLFSVSPYTKPVGQQFTGGAQSRIDAGQALIDYYTPFVAPLQIGGIIVALAGVVFVVLGARVLFPR